MPEPDRDDAQHGPDRGHRGSRLAPSGRTEAQIEECTQDLFAPDGLLVAGDRYMMTENGTTAKGRTVTNAIQRLTPQ
ncbi:MAG TPA: hypothetical protein VF469_13675 [Kofleriaceae bacterium]